MSQTTYNINTTNAFRGQLADLQNSTIRSYNALEAIGFGLGVAQSQAKSGSCRLPMSNKDILTVSTDLIASNSTVGDVIVTKIVAGVRTTTTTHLTATVYATSHVATWAAIAVKIAAVSGVASATASLDIITVLASPDVEVTLANFVTTLGSSQPTFTYTPSTTDILLGVSLFKQTTENDLTTGAANYHYQDAVNVLRRGAVFVAPELTIAAGDSVYWRFADDTLPAQAKGQFTNANDAGYTVAVTREFWPDAITGAAVGVLEVSLP